MTYKVLHDTPLRPFNTFGIDAKAATIFIIKDEEELVALLADYDENNYKILGGGSNILLVGDVDTPIIKMENKGITLIQDTEDAVYLAVAAGEVWHDFVLYTVAQNYYGIENLSLIPGTVGASPIQNIGAYGVEIKDVLHEVRYYDMIDKTFYVLQNEACQFGYRDSIFKHSLKGRCIITSVTFKLLKNGSLHTSYGQIDDELSRYSDGPYTIKDVSNAVIKIRSEKLPNPAEIGNCGSFFKNPVIPTAHFNILYETYPSIPSYIVPDGMKIPAAWLIEQCGWKGYRDGDIGVHHRQALVLVNHGQASGQDVIALSESIIASVSERFGIALEREVQVW